MCQSVCLARDAKFRWYEPLYSTSFVEGEAGLLSLSVFICCSTDTLSCKVGSVRAAVEHLNSDKTLPHQFFSITAV